MDAKATITESREIAVLREVVGKLTQLLAGRGIVVTQRGSRAYVAYDKNSRPMSVNIPFIPNDATEDLILAIQGFIDHEVAHLLHSDFTVLTKGHTLGVASLHNIVEDTFVERAICKTFPGSAHTLKRLHEFFLAKITEPALVKAGEDEKARFGVLLVPAIRALSGQGIFDDWMTNNGHWDNPMVKMLIDQMTAAEIASVPRLANTSETLVLAQRLKEILHPPAPPAPPPPPPPPASPPKEKDEDKEDESDDSDDPSPKGSDDREHDEDDDSTGGDEADKADKADGDKADKADGDKADKADGDKADKADELKDDGEGEADKDDELKGEADESDDGGADEAEGDGDEADGAGGGADEADGDGGDSDEADEGDEGGEDEKSFSGMFDEDWKPEEFDEKLTEHIGEMAKEALLESPYNIFTTDFDVIEPCKLTKNYKESDLVDLEDKTRGMTGTMQREIERLFAAKSQTVNVPGFKSGRLHSPSLHRLQTNDDRIFRRKHQNVSKKTALTLLVDNSGSMHSGRGSKTAIAMEAAFALANTLERVGLKHEVIGFNTTIRKERELGALIREDEDRTGIRYCRIEPLYMPIYKGFNERLTGPVKARFADTAYNASDFRNNVDGECVRIAARRLMKEVADRHIMIVLSDGSPSFATGRGSYGAPHHDLVNAIEWLKSTPVEVIGIGINSTAVERYYEKHMVIRDIASLPKVIMTQLRSIVLS